jgi:hypothetical protein
MKVWVGKLCGILSPAISPGCGEPEPELGEEDECILCDSPVHAACLARVVEMTEHEIAAGGGLHDA